MLHHLTIKNYALIDSLDISFPDGFITVTGETGAGKSIILGALSMLGGVRADVKAIRKGESKAIIEGAFLNPPASLKPFFKENNLDWDDNEIILRREISLSGRNRSFINDSPVATSLLAEVSPSLIDIHSQHNNLLLSSQKYQRYVLDSFGNYNEEIQEYSELFHKFSEAHARLTILKKEAASNRTEKDILQFQLEQLKTLDLKKGEYETLDREYRLLSESAEIREHLQFAYQYIEQGDSNAISLLQSAIQHISQVDLSILGKDMAESSLHERLAAIDVELRDITRTLGGYLEGYDADPRRLPLVESRLSEIWQSAKKFRCEHPENLVEIREDLQSRLDSIEGSNPEIEKLETLTHSLASKLRKLADKISDLRLRNATVFADELVKIASPLGLANLTFRIDISKGKIGPEGQDKVEFVCAFNKNQPFQPMSKVASGGEISRLMLSIKALVAEKMLLPTMIFDEIDSGVSGETAFKMGNLMRNLADKMQIITVTHLPQVAAKGTSQYRVYKQDTEDATITHLKRLSTEEREHEIARILSGDRINEASLLNAKSLLNNN